MSEETPVKQYSNSKHKSNLTASWPHEIWRYDVYRILKRSHMSCWLYSRDVFLLGQRRASPWEIYNTDKLTVDKHIFPQMTLLFLIRIVCTLAKLWKAASVYWSMTLNISLRRGGWCGVVKGILVEKPSPWRALKLAYLPRILCFVYRP